MGILISKIWRLFSIVEIPVNIQEDKIYNVIFYAGAMVANYNVDKTELIPHLIGL